MRNNKSVFIFLFATLLLLASLPEKSYAQLKNKVISFDGTWCWFSDPRAIYLPQGDGVVMTGYVTEEGSVASLLYNLKTKQVQQSILNRKLEVDDHNNPAFLQTNDSTVLAFYTKHHNVDLYMNRAKVKGGLMSWVDADTINPNGKAHLAQFGDDKYTYTNPFVLSGENNRIYLFGRWIGFKPNMSWSDDGGKTWADSRVIVARKPYKWANRPYVKYFSDGKEKIHIVFTDGHPRDEKKNSVYYAYYSKGAFFRADGHQICTIDQLPFEPKNATLVYSAKKTKQRAWVFDIAADSLGNPAIAYTRYPSTKEHIYHYTWFDGAKWHDREIVNSGKWFPQTPVGKQEREPHYSGGMSIDPNNTHTVYVSREVKSVFEIEMCVLDTLKNSWEFYSVTQNSKTDQVRPFVVRNVPDGVGTIVLWNDVEKYIHYTNFKSKIRMTVIK
jgi:hypothetical protein